MDLEVVGRHALFFDDDAMAAFVNSGDALVDWNSLQIDRYDVRHLLSAPLPPRRRRNPLNSSQFPDFAFESELDLERYLDLPSPSDEPDGEEAEKPGDYSAYHAVAFSYGNTEHSADQKNAEGELECSQFRPPFAVPESLLKCLPPTEKVHQIIARTATFVSKHGGQSEIVLRVKQGDNPTFGFLMPDHHLHPYFRFLVDHQELMQFEIDGKNQPEDRRGSKTQNSAVGGALSLLGSVYGSGEDEDSAIEGAHGNMNASSEKTFNTRGKKDYHGLEKGDFSSNDTEKDKGDARAKHPPTSNKERAPVLKKNPSMAASKSGIMNRKKEIDGSGSFSCSLDKSKEPLMLEPPSDLKRLIDKIVEFIVKNGKQFESTVREQDREHGRFPFLLPSNQYYPYFLKVLQRAEESKLGSRNSFHGREDFMARNVDKRSLLSKDDDASLSGSVGSDLPFESDRKEKFKMVLGKGKKEFQDPPSISNHQEYGISVDATAAAAILQAATRGIRNPDLGIISSIAINGSSHDHEGLVGRISNFRSQASSQQNEIVQLPDQEEGHDSTLLIAETAKGAVADTAGKEDSSEAHLSKEQKLKAERLKRAKMFVAKLKGGAGPSTVDPSQSSLAEPVESGTLVNCVDKAIEGTSVPVDSCIPDESENTGRKHFGEEYSERRLRRKYRLRSERHAMDDGNSEEEDTEENHTRKKHRSHGSSEVGNGRFEKDEEERDKKHSKKKHRCRYSSYEDDYSNEDRKGKSHKHSRKKHRSHHPCHEDEDGETGYHKQPSKQHASQRSSSHERDDKRDFEDESYHKSRKKHRSHRDSDKHTIGSHRRRSKHESSSDTDDMRGQKHRKESHRRRSRHESSSDTDDTQSDKRRKESHQRRSEHESSLNTDDTRNDKRRKESHRRRSKHEFSSDTDDMQSHKHRKDSDRRRSKHNSSSDSDGMHSHKPRKESQKKSNYKGSSDTEDRDHRRYAEHLEKEDLEEGEISSKMSDRSRGSVTDAGSGETLLNNGSTCPRASSEPSEATEVSDDLRAKIRAMLMANR